MKQNFAEILLQQSFYFYTSIHNHLFLGNLQIKIDIIFLAFNIYSKIILKFQ
ncbi:hypothetical protein CCYN49044_340030 [Capnocytophaga cynodegmi]|uniref:Uncharacterized protein n=1 Tax=Capnocytophaga cynodegmi TaxID=28189 RepID=A0A0B7HRX2_9FLAO|nr:hypothetical protein CCYN49044_340030 [Capnocytophaga cynodegmi]CEN42035.1 hypothetical protein CCYN74_90030 [Capnocytophaga cynodegmi]